MNSSLSVLVIKIKWFVNEKIMLSRKLCIQLNQTKT